MKALIMREQYLREQSAESTNRYIYKYRPDKARQSTQPIYSLHKKKHEPM